MGSRRIFSGANPAYTQSEIEHQLHNTEAQEIPVHQSLVKTAVPASHAVGVPASCIFQFADYPCPMQDSIANWRAIIGGEDEAQLWKLDEMKSTATSIIATINYSSGTTGLPKGVYILHQNLIANINQTIFMRNQEILYAAMPVS